MYASCRCDPWHNVLIPNDLEVTLFFRAVGDFAIRSRELVNTMDEHPFAARVHLE